MSDHIDNRTNAQRTADALDPQDTDRSGDLRTHSRLQGETVSGGAIEVTYRFEDVGNEEYTWLHFENPPLEEWPDDETPKDLNIETPVANANFVGWWDVIKQASIDDVDSLNLLEPDIAGDLDEAGDVAGELFDRDGFWMSAPNYAYRPDPVSTIRVVEDPDPQGTGDAYDGQLDLSEAWQTDGDFFETDAAGPFNRGGGRPLRGLYRVIPPGEKVTLGIFNDDGGGVDIGLGTIVYEANFRYDGVDSTTATEGY